MIELLQAFVHAQQREVRVIVGLDDAVPGMQDMVLIGAPVSLGSRASGTVAVIASTRIQYEEMMRTVGFIAQLSERVLTERVLTERGADGGAQPGTER